MTFIDFFAGIGGFRRGMELAGHKCVGFCEFDKFAVASYTAMHLEKLLKKDVIVIDRDMKEWRIIGVRGRYIERKTFLLDRIGAEGTKECGAAEIYPFEPFLAAKAKLENDRKNGWTTREAERRPRWFDIAAQVEGEGKK